MSALVMEPAEQTAFGWKIARNCDAGSCVEVAQLPDGGIAIRDSKHHGQGPALVFTAIERRAFVDGVKNGDFD